MDEPLPNDGRRRVVIENVRPRVDDGQFAVKHIVHDPLAIEADIMADGHDVLVCVLRYRAEERAAWLEKPLESQHNDLYRAELTIDRIGRWQFMVVAWLDHFATWRYDLTKRAAAGQDLSVEFLIGANLCEAAATRLGEKKSADKRIVAEVEELRAVVAQLRDVGRSSDLKVEAALALPLSQLMHKHADRGLATESAVYEIVVDRPRARFSNWYELFPRSCGPSRDVHGTLRDVQAKLPRIAEMGFDVLYMPPIHPIGDAFRKGKNNNPTAQPGDVGSPWAIGGQNADGSAGGHKAIHAELGTLNDFKNLVFAANQVGIEIALDIAFQCAPDHPYAHEHVEWFRKRPDGTIQYAENPPKKYQDIYPFDFETNAWPQLWHELKSVFEYWIELGVRIFRVDNPHTKPFGFWQWAIGDLKHKYPDVLFLAEAFTRPKIMYRLAKLGFSQSYTYFTWRNQKPELIEYFTELSTAPVNRFFRPNLWPNTPDILHEFLQDGSRAAFAIRLVLAAMLGANYGLYAPAYELLDHRPREPGSEEYLDSEKYEIKEWDWDWPDSLRPLITTVNRIRREHSAAQRDDTLRFHLIENDSLIAFTKHSPDRRDVLLTVVSLDPHNQQAGWLELKNDMLPHAMPEQYELRDLLSGQAFQWEGSRAYIELNPERPAHVFLLP